MDHSLLDFGFTFDNVLGPDTAQESIYECTTKELIDNALQGINGCIMAYGQTGAGKFCLSRISSFVDAHTNDTT